MRGDEGRRYPSIEKLGRAKCKGFEDDDIDDDEVVRVKVLCLLLVL
jgi:hypothetical protein